MTELCPYTDEPIDKCLCMIHDPDGTHFWTKRALEEKEDNDIPSD